LGLEPVGNLALRPALSRYFMHIPEGQDGQGRFVHPWNVDVLTLPPEAAAPLVAGVMLALVAGAAWSLRRGGNRLRAVVAWDCAAVAILALLLSPITWRQHCVAILPACYLIARAWLAGEAVPPIASAAIGTLVVVSLLLARGVVGDTVSSLVHAYYLHTLALLLLLAGVIACRNRRLDVIQ
jgi:alpha-1,2-mannosyltransferase